MLKAQRPEDRQLFFVLVEVGQHSVQHYYKAYGHREENNYPRRKAVGGVELGVIVVKRRGKDRILIALGVEQEGQQLLLAVSDKAAYKAAQLGLRQRFGILQRDILYAVDALIRNCGDGQFPSLDGHLAALVYAQFIGSVPFEHDAAAAHFELPARSVGDADKGAVFFNSVHHRALALAVGCDIRLIICHLFKAADIAESFQLFHKFFGGHLFKEYLTVVLYSFVKDLSDCEILGSDEGEGRKYQRGGCRDAEGGYEEPPLAAHKGGDGELCHGAQRADDRTQESRYLCGGSHLPRHSFAGTYPRDQTGTQQSRGQRHRYRGSSGNGDAKEPDIIGQLRQREEVLEIAPHIEGYACGDQCSREHSSDAHQQTDGAELRPDLSAGEAESPEYAYLTPALPDYH